MIYLGIFILLIWLVLVFFVFGFTFGTTFIAFLGFSIIFWSVLNLFQKNIRYYQNIKIFKRIIASLLLIWLISLVFIEFLIFSVESDEEIKVDYLIVLGRT